MPLNQNANDKDKNSSNSRATRSKTNAGSKTNGTSQGRSNDVACKGNKDKAEPKKKDKSGTGDGNRKNVKPHEELKSVENVEPPRVKRKRNTSEADGTAAIAEKPKPKKSKENTHVAPDPKKTAATIASKGKPKAAAPEEVQDKAEFTKKSDSRAVKPTKPKPAVEESDEESDEDDEPRVKSRSLKKAADTRVLSDASDEENSTESDRADTNKSSDDDEEESERDEFEGYSDGQVDAIVENEGVHVVGGDEEDAQSNQGDNHSDDIGTLESHNLEGDIMDVDETPRASKVAKSSKSRATRKGKGRRQEKFEAELPAVKVNSEKKGQVPGTAIARDNSDWPEHAQLRQGGIEKQAVFIRAVFNEANRRETIKLLTGDAFPDLPPNRAPYWKSIVVEAAEALASSFPKQVPAVLKRAEVDAEFTQFIGKAATDRYPTKRGVVKANASTEIAAYELGTGGKCVLRVEELTKADAFVFPGMWTGAELTTWKPDRTEPYGNDVLIKVLKSSYFKDAGSIGYEAVKDYNTAQRNVKPILPPAMIALAATGVRAVLHEWSTGTHKASKFDGNSFISVYRKQMRSLDIMKNGQPDAFQTIMGILHDRVVGERSYADADSVAAEGAASLWDVSKYANKDGH